MSIAGYNNLTNRDNLFNQTDLIARFATGPVRHILLAGMELGRQETTNLRQTAYFQGANGAFTETSVNTPLSQTRIGRPIQWRQAATDASNTGTNHVVSLYLQDQIELLPQLQLIAGLRWDHIDAEITNRRTGERLSATDNNISPRVGLVYRPIDPVSLYASYSVSFLQRELPAALGRAAGLAERDEPGAQAGILHQLRDRRTLGDPSAPDRDGGDLSVGADQCRGHQSG
ncbi:TonB-dependent receptor domain-containing protein [Roseococcus sp.]|uniref:TonB-dependent receptor domain-containing protein n=1 Tax=Roseococcus sp. TaxID=2109646 RepID=UPI003BAA82BC